MKKSITALALTVMFCFVCIISASAVSELSPDETLTRKRAYYAGINNSVALLSKNIGSLENVQIKRIVVQSKKDFTSEADVKNTAVAEAQDDSSDLSVCIYIQFSASNSSSVQEYLFSRYLAVDSTYTLCSLNSFKLDVFNYNFGISYISNASESIASGISYAADTYWLDIDLSDYQNSGYSLSIPFQQPSGNEATALFPLLRMRAYYSSINDSFSVLSQKIGSLQNIQIKRIIVESSKDFISEADVKENIRSESKTRPLHPSINFYFLFSASKGSSTCDYVFTHMPVFYTAYGLTPLTSINTDTINFKTDVSHLESYSAYIASGIAYTNVLGGQYYLDINLSDYQAQGYSLVIAD